MMCKVSVLVPVYNVEQYLPQCMDSLVSQTLPEIEILCINDGSTDHSLKILQTYAERDKRVRILDKKNTGYGDSMNLGIRSAKGEYIGIVESDDFASVDMFQSLYAYAKTYHADLVKSAYFIYSDRLGNQIIPSLDGLQDGEMDVRTERKNLLYVTPTIWSGLYRRHFLLEKEIFFAETPGASYQDTSFNLKAILFAEKIAVLKKPFLHYRIDNAGSSVRNKEKVFCICDEYGKVWKLLKKRAELHDAYASALAEVQYMGYSWNLDRVDDSLKYIFLQRFSHDFQEHMKDEKIQLCNWKFLENRLQMEALKHDVKKWMFDRLVDTQRKRLLLDGLFGVIAAQQSVYIFGGGNIAHEVVVALRERDISIKGFIVSDKKRMAAWMQGENLLQVDEMDVSCQKSLILIAVKEQDLLSVYETLQGHGTHDIIMMTKEMRINL